MENSTLTNQAVEKEEVVMEIVFGTSFLQSDVNITWYRNNLMVRNSSRVEITADVVDDFFRLYTTRLRIKSARDYDHGTVTTRIVDACVHQQNENLNKWRAFLL